MSEIKLLWDSAKVRDNELTVELDGEASSEWEQSFEHTVRLLGGGDWGRVRIKKGAVRIDAIALGEEDKVRFFLESVVEQANANEIAEELQRSTGADEDATGVDAEMAERFRSYSSGDEEQASG